MSSGKRNETLRGSQHLEREHEAGHSGSSTHRLRPMTKRTPEEDPTACRNMEESTGALKRSLSESFVKPNGSKSSNTVQDPCGVKPLLTEASKSYRNSLMINQKLPARSLVGSSGSQSRLPLRLVSGKSRRDSPWPSQENLTFLKKNRSVTTLSDDGAADGATCIANDPEDVDQLKTKPLKPSAGKSRADSNDGMLADRMAMWDPWAGVGVAVDQAEQRPVVVVHSEPTVTTFSILKNDRPGSEQGSGAAPGPPQEKRVKWRETVDVILYSGDSVVGRHTEQLREEWGAGRTLGGMITKRGSIDRCPYVDPGPLY